MSSGTNVTPTTDSHTNKKDAEHVRQYLTLNNLLIDDEEAAETKKAKGILDDAQTLLIKPRLSPKNPEMIGNWLKQQKKEKYSQEPSFMSTMWWIIVRKKRSVKETREAQENADDFVVRRYWSADNLRFRVDQEFTRGYTPGVDTKNEFALAMALAKEEGMQNPKPDIAYGLDEDVFKQIGRVANQLHVDLAQLSTGMFHPFFIIEFKSHKGSLLDAEHQACRGGAVMVNTMGMLKEKAGMEDKGDKFDAGSFAFSLALDPHNARMYVHWRENQRYGGKVKVFYHMQRLAGYLLDDGESVDKLRIAINNVLDWGVGARKAWVLHMLSNLEAKHEEEERLASRTRAGKSASDKASSGTKSQK